MNISPAPHSWLILTAVLCGAGIDLFALWISSPESPPALDAPTWSLTAADFVARPDDNRGIWPVDSADPFLSSADDPKAWTPVTSRESLVLEPMGASVWTRGSFPTREHIPSFGLAQVMTAPAASPTELTACPSTTPQEFKCAPEDWAHIKIREVPIQGKVTSCIWVHALPQTLITITYPDTPPPKARGLMLDVAFHDEVTKDDENPVQITTTHGAETSSYSARNTRRGWQKFAITSGSERAPLTLTFSADKPGRHQLCYQLTSAPLKPTP